jgi:outer membrane lipoprotein LolB
LNLQGGRSFVRHVGGFVLLGALASCAMFRPPQATPQQKALQQVGHWQGRLSLRVLQPTPEQFSASFEINGSADNGELSLYSPLGTTLARARWTPDNAQLLQADKVQNFASIEALTQQLTGAALPLPALLAWLDSDGPALPGWQLNSESPASGRRVFAKRETPLPALQLTLLLEPK